MSRTRTIINNRKLSGTCILLAVVRYWTEAEKVMDKVMDKVVDQVMDKTLYLARLNSFHHYFKVQMFVLCIILSISFFAYVGRLNGAE